MLNKKGDGSSTVWIIIGVVLGLAVLVMLLYYFITGLNPFAGIIIPGAGSIGSIPTQCTQACVQGNKYDFCSIPRSFKLVDGTKVNPSCNELAILTDYEQYGINECPGIVCDASSAATTTTDTTPTPDATTSGSASTSTQAPEGIRGVTG